MARKDAKSKAAAAATKAINNTHTSSTPSTPIKPTHDKTAASQPYVKEVTHSIQVSYESYLRELQSNQKLRLIDTFLAFLVALGILQFVYCVIIGNFPFNAFLGGFIATVGQFVLTVSLRLQGARENQTLFSQISPERAFGDYIFASLILHFVVIHFIN
ncbi:unnamed protein product [Ambrosiozyma monospora]|uniref:Dolichyl-diphosphooligosaccharide--protein glycosyltransferase subunit OST2 n=1 Tax=Ambrosiozyma monospora TaxID=43982 RepID=A0A9W6YUA5_AMBMO|nr:unnamed protein product [Ambrosiozyma monospora]